MIGGLLLGLLGLALLVLVVPVLVFALQVAAACLPARRQAVAATPRPPLAVLVPAHNEALGIARTLQALKTQLRPGDRLLVVADNCSDDTAERARIEGAEVIERQHAEQRGKGYALAFGVDHLRAAPPALLAIVDADCLPDPGALDTLAAACVREGVPIQALYLMLHDSPPGLHGRVSAFAWRVKNWVRPRGAARLGWPCQLMGSGMVFPWALAERARWASASIVEDMQMGLVLSAEGHAPLFCEAARVHSFFPSSQAAAMQQRTRWEHGHLGMTLQQMPRLLGLALRRGDWRLLGLALDLSLPPFALLVLLMTALWAVTGLVTWMVGGAWLWQLATALLALLALAVAVAWAGWGRPVLGALDLLRAPWYALSKIALYARFWSRRQKDWVRTDRK
ncbi:MAG TPA: glycosyltransferase family 2 protein [Ideonella sp.]|nr:glycosyltransferase family 2 protein [Ideonella sp.]